MRNTFIGHVEKLPSGFPLKTEKHHFSRESVARSDQFLVFVCNFQHVLIIFNTSLLYIFLVICTSTKIAPASGLQLASLCRLSQKPILFTVIAKQKTHTTFLNVGFQNKNSSGRTEAAVYAFYAKPIVRTF